MKMRGGGKLILIALFFALSTCATLFWYLRGVQSESTGNLQEIVVVKQGIPANREVKGELLEVKKMPEAYVPPNAVRSISQAAGKITKVPVAAGEILSVNHLTQDRAEGGLAFLIPPGNRAMTIAVNQVTGVAQLINPGNYVDVLVFLDKEFSGNYIEKILLQKKLVLAVDTQIQTEGMTSSEGDKKIEVKTITLAVTPAEAQQLGLAQEIGSVRLILRPQEENTLYQGGPVSPANLIGQQSSGAAPKPVQ